MDPSILQEFGLTKGETKVYLALLELGSVKSGKIIEKSGLQSSVVYNCLHSLLEKGLVNYIIKGKIKFYQSSTPETLLAFVDEKRNQLKQLLPELVLKQRLAGETPFAEVYIGIKGIFTMLNTTLLNAKKGEEWLFFVTQEYYQKKEVRDFFEKFDKHRKEAGVIVKGIGTKQVPVDIERMKKGYLQMRYVSHAIPSGVTIY